MYEICGAVNALARSDEQKIIVKSFFQAFGTTYQGTVKKKGEAALAGNELSLKALDALHILKGSNGSTSMMNLPV